MNDAAIERGIGTALWRQIAGRIEARIQSGQLKPGAQLPTEQLLAKEFSVNRHTIRRAIATLVEDGWVHVVQGRGSFVQEAVIHYPIGRRTRFSEYLAAQSLEPSGDLLQATEMAAEAPVAKALQIRKGSKVTLLEIRRLANKVPISIATHYFSHARFPDLADCYRETGSITLALKRLGITDYTRKVTKVTARTIRAQDAKLLGQRSSRPILLVESINIDVDGVPIEYGVTRWASDRVEIVFEPER